MVEFGTGFLLGLSLILPIGAQNAFVLREGLIGRHILAVCIICTVSDGILMGAGIAGFATVTGAFPQLGAVLSWIGAIFLVIYGGAALKSAIRGGARLDPADENGGRALRRTILTTLALTWLNPHVYLDTLVLVGSVATRFPGAELSFWAGATAASLIFFFALGYGARLLRPVFARPRAWQILDISVALIMFSIAGGLVWAQIGLASAP